ncbi:hypothetical protein D3C87_2089400 [compost metagenome]
MTRMKMPSQIPPHQAESRPMMVPARVAQATEAKAISMDCRIPTIRRLKASRPNRSVPNQ